MRTWRPHWPCPVAVVLEQLRHGGGDPTWRRGQDGAIWRGLRTPEGTATLCVLGKPGRGEVLARAWGEGADWALEAVPAMLGACDDPSDFQPHHEAVRRAWRQHPHLRIARTGLLLESLIPAVIEQKVTGKEAFAGWRALVRRHGELAPGADAELGLWVMPAPETIRAIPSWEWLAMHIDPARSRTVAAVVSRAGALERLVDRPAAEVDRSLRSIPGIGEWTSAEARARVLGDADAVSFGDYHVPKDIGWALTGKPVDDAGLAELLEPYRPQRGRVQLLLTTAGFRRPRRGPRLSVPMHYPSSL